MRFPYHPQPLMTRDENETAKQIANCGTLGAKVIEPFYGGYKGPKNFECSKAIPIDKACYFQGRPPAFNGLSVSTDESHVHWIGPIERKIQKKNTHRIKNAITVLEALDTVSPLVTPIGVLKSTNPYRGITLTEHREVSKEHPSWYALFAGKEETGEITDSKAKYTEGEDHVPPSPPTERPSVALSEGSSECDDIHSFDGDEMKNKIEVIELGRGRSTHRWEQWVTITAPFGRAHQEGREIDSSPEATYDSSASITAFNQTTPVRRPYVSEIEVCSRREASDIAEMTEAVTKQLEQKQQPLRFLKSLHGNPAHAIEKEKGNKKGVPATREISSCSILRALTSQPEGKCATGKSPEVNSKKVKIRPLKVNFGAIQVNTEYVLAIKIQNCDTVCQYVSVSSLALRDRCNQHCIVRARFHGGKIVPAGTATVLVLVKSIKPGGLAATLEIVTGSLTSKKVSRIPIEAHCLSNTEFKLRLEERKPEFKQCERLSQTLSDTVASAGNAVCAHDHCDEGMTEIGDDPLEGPSRNSPSVAEASRVSNRGSRVQAYLSHSDGSRIRGSSTNIVEEHNEGIHPGSISPDGRSSPTSPIFPRSHSARSMSPGQASNHSLQHMVKAYDLEHALFVGTEIEDRVAGAQLMEGEHERKKHEHTDILGVMTQPPLSPNLKSSLSPHSKTEHIVSEETEEALDKKDINESIPYFPDLIIPGGIKKGGTNAAAVPLVEAGWSKPAFQVS